MHAFLGFPPDGTLTVHAAKSSVQIVDPTGSVHVAAVRGRSSVFNPSGTVTIAAAVIDLAAARGHIELDGTEQINLKIDAAHFGGSVSARSGGPMKVLTARDFATPFLAVVSSRDAFICRTEFSKDVECLRVGGLFYFTYLGQGDAEPLPIQFYSRCSTVVIDTI